VPEGPSGTILAKRSGIRSSSGYLYIWVTSPWSI
jgi:hypothetical protein